MRTDRQSVVNHPPAQMGETAYVRGYGVGRNGLPRGCNPHPYGSIPWVYWRRGHAAGAVAAGHLEQAPRRWR